MLTKTVVFPIVDLSRAKYHLATETRAKQQNGKLV